MFGEASELGSEVPVPRHDPGRHGTCAHAETLLTYHTLVKVFAFDLGVVVGLETFGVEQVGFPLAATEDDHSKRGLLSLRQLDALEGESDQELLQVGECFDCRG